MLSKEQNDLVTQTGPGTPGGAMFRRYWLPVALSEELPHDGAPVPVVAPEHLVAMKMVAGRPKDEEDVRYLVLAEDFDMASCTVIVEEHLVGGLPVERLQMKFDEVAKRRSAGNKLPLA